MTELACQTTLLASIIVMVSQARAYFGLVPPVKGEGRVFDRRFWLRPPSTLGGRVGTLGGGGISGGRVVLGGSTVLVGWGCSWLVAWLKIVARLLIASICLSPMLEKGALGAGFCNACASSAAAVVAFSAEEGNGMTQLWGEIRPCLLFCHVLCCLCTLGGTCSGPLLGLSTIH